MSPSQGQPITNNWLMCKYKGLAPSISVWDNSEGSFQLQSSPWDHLGLKLPLPNSAPLMPLGCRFCVYSSTNILGANLCLRVCFPGNLACDKLFYSSAPGYYPSKILGIVALTEELLLPYLELWKILMSLWKINTSDCQGDIFIGFSSSSYSEREILPLANWTVPRLPNCTPRVVALIILAADPTSLSKD